MGTGALVGRGSAMQRAAVAQASRLEHSPLPKSSQLLIPSARVPCLSLWHVAGVWGC